MNKNKGTHPKEGAKLDVDPVVSSLHDSIQHGESSPTDQTSQN